MLKIKFFCKILFCVSTTNAFTGTTTAPENQQEFDRLLEGFMKKEDSHPPQRSTTRPTISPKDFGQTTTPKTFLPTRQADQSAAAIARPHSQANPTTTSARPVVIGYTPPASPTLTAHRPTQPKAIQPQSLSSQKSPTESRNFPPGVLEGVKYIESMRHTTDQIERLENGIKEQEKIISEAIRDKITAEMRKHELTDMLESARYQLKELRKNYENADQSNQSGKSFLSRAVSFFNITRHFKNLSKRLFGTDEADQWTTSDE